MRLIMMKVSTIVIFSILLSSNPVSAADRSFPDFFQEAPYSILIRSLIIGAAIAFTQKNVDPLVNFGIGAGCGAIGGTFFELSKTIKTENEVDNVKFAMPTIIPNLFESPYGSKNFTFTVGLIHVAY